MLSTRRLLHVPSFLQYVGISPQTPAMKESTLLSKKITEENKPPKRSKLRSFFIPNSKLDLLKRLINGGILTFAILKAPPFWESINKVAQEINMAPKAVAAQMAEQTSEESMQIDRFAENFAPELRSSLDLLDTTERQSIDLNKNGIFLDTSNEIDKLISLRSNSEEEENEVEQYLIDAAQLQSLIWNDGIDPKSITQNGSNCQVTSTLLGLSLDKQNVQKLKDLVEITDYNLDPENFYINAKVKINGEFVDVKYTDLTIWRSLGSSLLDQYYPNYSLGPDFIALAVEKELKAKKMPLPSSLPSSSQTMLLGKDHYTYPVMPLSDEDLVNVFSYAPNSSITLGSYPDLLTYGATIGLHTGANEEAPKSLILPGHAYAVKGVKTIGGIHYVRLLSTNPNTNSVEETELSMSELRTSMITVSADKNVFSNYNKFKTISILLYSAALILLVREGINRLEKRKLEKATLPQIAK